VEQNIPNVKWASLAPGSISIHGNCSAKYIAIIALFGRSLRVDMRQL
jgi:hypothetical protein